ncbi:hypothetical protein I4F81_000731 [Pyropia yezoensis]|uniref:Uncharacterized protein n=1 Tax=Pyropia yezoensis TaxID=2788 RepID=A0ACC3BKI0_PYRYE|nr:hypothetical protein I4F81_000731 [Neopyropia yezoensis]
MMLAPHPGRAAVVLIARDAELVVTLAHLARMSLTRVAWYLASSPGMGKTHFAWDLILAVADVNNERYALAAKAAKLPRLHDVASTLRQSRGTEAVLLPVYLRILWCLRCADECDFERFCDFVQKMLASKATTVEAVYFETLQALADQPTIIIVEELAKVPPVPVVYDRPSPAESAFEAEDACGAGDGGGTPLQPSAAAVMLPVLYRHELCTLTRSESISVLLTAVCPGTLLKEVRLLVDESERAALDADVNEIVKQLPNAAEAASTLLVTSISSNQRPGSPYYILFAVKVGFLDLQEVADAYFLPLFNSSRVVRMSVQHHSTHKQPASLSAQASAWLSGGHGLSAAVLLDHVDRAVGPVWSSVVVPAAGDLSLTSNVNILINDLLSVPVVILAAVHNCTLNAKLPLVSGIDLRGVSLKTWDDLFAVSLLTDAVRNSEGLYKDPCMPPLFLVVLLRLWKLRRSSLMAEFATAQYFIRLRDVLDALLSVYSSRDSTGGADDVWEYVSLRADVVLTRLRAASPAWSLPSLGLFLPHDYRSVTLSQLYPGTRVFHTGGPHPVLDDGWVNAVPPHVVVNDDVASNGVPPILARTRAELVTTVFKCKSEQTGFDYIKLLPLNCTSADGTKEELFVICTSCKCTGASMGYLNVKTHVRDGLLLMKASFGDSWEEWKGRAVFVVASHLRTAKNPSEKLTPEESSNVIIIARDDHVAIYRRALSGFVGQGPTLFGAKLLEK